VGLECLWKYTESYRPCPRNMRRNLHTISEGITASMLWIGDLRRSTYPVTWAPRTRLSLLKVPLLPGRASLGTKPFYRLMSIFFLRLKKLSWPRGTELVITRYGQVNLHWSVNKPVRLRTLLLQLYFLGHLGSNRTQNRKLQGGFAVFSLFHFPSGFLLPITTLNLGSWSHHSPVENTSVTISCRTESNTFDMLSRSFIFLLWSHLPLLSATQKPTAPPSESGAHILYLC
jgi:hypothetical protein